MLYPPHIEAAKNFLRHIHFLEWFRCDMTILGVAWRQPLFVYCRVNLRRQILCWLFWCCPSLPSLSQPPYPLPALISQVLEYSSTWQQFSMMPSLFTIAWSRKSNVPCCAVATNIGNDLKRSRKRKLFIHIVALVTTSLSYTHEAVFRCFA